VDDVVVVDDHITGVLSEHETGKTLDVPASGIKIKGRRSTPGRYFQVAGPGTGWGGTDIDDPLKILGPFNPKVAWEGLRLFMVSTTGEQFGYYELDADLLPQKKDVPEKLAASAQLIAENCEPSVCSVLFMGGAGGSLRAGVTENPVQLTRSVKDAFDPCILWRCGCLCLARRRDYSDGGCSGYADAFFWLCADACAGRSDRVHVAGQ
jgi:hypothetical protein